jgi:predicted DNA-binding protein
MSEGNLTPTPVRFSAEFIARVDAISKSMALSHSTVLRLAVNQWFEAGGDKGLLSALAKKSAKKAGKTRRNGDIAY